MAAQLSSLVHPQTAAKISRLRIIGVRGSTEPQGGSRLLKPMGVELVNRFDGPASYEELRYPATIDHFDPPADIDLGESPSIGVRNLINLVNVTTTQYPTQGIVLLGYSQGAQVVGDALVDPDDRVCGYDAGEISSKANARVVAVVLFGDPRFTKGESFNMGTFDVGKEGLTPRMPGTLLPYASRLQNYCAKDDVTCQGRDGTLHGHTEYFRNTMRAEAIAFVAQSISSHTRQS